MHPDTVAVTVSWNCRDRLLELLAALRAENPLRVVVVDNGSSDGTSAAVAAAFPEVELVSLRSNTGGSGGFAIAMRRALAHGARYVWLLDSDALPALGCLAALKAGMADGVGAVAARIVTDQSPSMVQECGGILSPVLGRPRFIAAGQPAQAEIAAADVEFAAACCLLTDAAWLARCGIFDPRWFVFFDDIEFSCRLRRGGARIRSAPGAFATHPWHGGKPMAPWRAYYGIRNQILFHRRRAPRHLRLLRTVWWTAYGLRIARAAQRAGCPAVAAAARAALDDAAAGVTGRRAIAGGTPLVQPLPRAGIGEGLLVLALSLRSLTTRRIRARERSRSGPI